METPFLLAALVIGSVGFAYVIYGRKQSVTLAWIAGLGLMALPYLLDSLIGVVVIDVVLMALPILIKVQGRLLCSIRSPEIIRGSRTGWVCATAEVGKKTSIYCAG
jgi:uncharacterized membrane protein